MEKREKHEIQPFNLAYEKLERILYLWAIFAVIIALIVGGVVGYHFGLDEANKIADPSAITSGGTRNR